MSLEDKELMQFKVGKKEQYAARMAFFIPGFAISTWAPMIPMIPMIKERLHIEADILGLLLLCIGISAFIVIPIGGLLGKKFGCKKVMVTTGSLFAIVLVALSCLPNVWSYAICLILVGAIMGCTEVCMNINAVVVEKLSQKRMMSSMHGFWSVGMLFGSDGLFQIHFEDYSLAEKICSAALIFIMFYGGFGTKWKTARPIAKQAVLLSTFGVFITAALTGIFCHLVLGLPPLEGLLIGAVLSSTDAASVFSILRSQKLNLKYSTAPMLEIESGSNDPCAYMLTIILLTSIGSSLNFFDISYLIFAQFAYGIIIGVILAFIASWILKNVQFGENGFDSIFLVAIALAAYALPSLVDGNGYLSTYIAGIILGNQNIPKKKNLVNFFDAFNGMMQMLIFFLLGLLVFPSILPYYFVPALFIAIFLTFIARPITMAILLSPFKAPLNQQLIMSWAGLRGAASIVFAIVAVVSPNYADDSIFSIVFCVVLY